MKEIKEILLPARCEAISAISAISVGLLVSHMHIVFLLSHGHRLCRFACRRNKRNKGNLHSLLGEALSAISALSAGLLVSHADSFYCPTVIGFAASLVEEMKEIKEIFVPTREAFLLFLLFLRDLKHASWLDLFYYPKEIKEILLPARCEAISAISAISVGLLVSHAESFFVPRSSALPLRSSKK